MMIIILTTKAEGLVKKSSENLKSVIKSFPFQSLTIFGRDVSKIPCFRESFMYGISSGIVIGLGCFMSTSKPRLAQHVAIGSFMLITLSYWFHCR